MTHMPVEPEAIRRLREARAWSQEHLASVAGLSLRTVQRVESAGAASAETRMALAAALQVDLQALAPSVTITAHPSTDEVLPAEAVDAQPEAVWSYQHYRVLRAVVVVGVVVGLDVLQTGQVTWSRWVLALGLAFVALRLFRQAFVGPRSPRSSAARRRHG